MRMRMRVRALMPVLALIPGWVMTRCLTGWHPIR
jgi:hypothetical protein